MACEQQWKWRSTLKQQPNKKLLSAMISSAILMTGCGAGGDDVGSAIQRAIEDNLPADSSGDASQPAGGGDQSSSSNPFSGSSLIEGAIALSSLVGLDAAAIESAQQTPKRAQISVRSAFVQPRAGTETSGNAVVKLFAVSADGELTDTGLNCTFSADKNENGDPKYTCDGVADGNAYVVKYVRLLDGNKAIEMKVNVDLPEGAATVAAEEISPKSTVVVDAIVKAVLSATEGKEIDREVVKDIIKSVKETVKTLVDSGAVQIPSVVGEAPKDAAGNYVDNVTKLAQDDQLKFAENAGLDEATGALLSREEVAAKVDAVKVKIEVRALKKIDTNGAEGKESLVKKIFEKLLDNDAPAFIIDFFAERYVDGKTVSLGDLFDSVYTGLSLDESFGVDLSDLKIDSASAASAFSDLLSKIYKLEADREAGSLTGDEEKELAEIPGVISVAFPAAQWRNAQIDEATELSVPQGIVFTIFMTDKLVPDAFKTATGKELRSVMNVKEQDQRVEKVEFADPVRFDPMKYDEEGAQPGLLQLFGFFDPATLEQLKGVDITDLHIMPDSVWIPDGNDGPAGPGGSEHDALRANVCLMDLGAIAAPVSTENGEDSESALSVKLKYPKRSGGSGTVELVNERDVFKDSAPIDSSAGSERPPEGGGPEACFTLDPWAKARAAGDGSEPTVDDIVSDFTSGDYVVVVEKSGSPIAERTFRKKVIVGMQTAAPELVSPRGMPQWPAECNGKTFCPEWDELNRKWQEAGGNTTFAINADSNGDEVDDKARITVNWKKPDVDLPEGVKVAYDLSIFRNGGCDENGCDFENIYSSQEKGRRIFGRAFVVPRLLEKLPVDKGSYNVNVCAEFIDVQSGEYLGSGGCSFADFNIGEPLDMSKEFYIEGAAVVEGEPAATDGWKVALIRENTSASASLGLQSHEPETIAVSAIQNQDGKYALFPTLGDFLNQPASTRFNIVVFKDENDDDVVDFPSGEQPGERVIWPSWENQVRFDTWGGVLRVVSEKQGASPSDVSREELILMGDETVEGPSFNVPADPTVGEVDIKPSPDDTEPGTGDGQPVTGGGEASGSTESDTSVTPENG